MTTYLPEDVEDEPATILTNWQVFEIPAGSRHFAGIRHDGIARVSSPIQTFIPKGKLGITRSSRIYLLKDEPETNERVEALIAEWCNKYRINTIRNVTDDYRPQSKSEQH